MFVRDHPDFPGNEEMRQSWGGSPDRWQQYQEAVALWSEEADPAEDDSSCKDHPACCTEAYQGWWRDEGGVYWRWTTSMSARPARTGLSSSTVQTERFELAEEVPPTRPLRATDPAPAFWSTGRGAGNGVAQRMAGGADGEEDENSGPGAAIQDAGHQAAEADLASATGTYEVLMATSSAGPSDERSVQEVLLSSASIGGQGDNGALDSACNSTVSGDAYAHRIEERCRELGIAGYIKKEPQLAIFRFGNGQKQVSRERWTVPV